MLKISLIPMLNKIAVILVLKALNLPAFLNIPDRTTADYLYYKPFYTIIPHRIFLILCYFADIVVAYRLKSLKYLEYTLFSTLDISCIENMILALSPSNLDFLLQFIDPAYYRISGYSYFKENINYLPSLSGFWYHNMAMVNQYYSLTTQLLQLWSYFFTSIDLRLIFIFKSQSNFRNYLLVVWNSKFLHEYTVLNISFIYLSYLFYNYEIVNTNFLYWNSLIFILIYIFDIKKNYRRFSNKK